MVNPLTLCRAIYELGCYVDESRLGRRGGRDRSSEGFSPVLRGFWISVTMGPPRKMVTEPVDSLTVTAMESVTAVIAAAA